MAIQRVKFAVLMEDGTEYPEVMTNLFDQVAYDRERIRRRWPPMQDNQMTFAAFTAYSAMRRQGMYTGTYDDFLNAVAAVDEHNDDADDDVDPYAWTDPADAHEPIPSMAQEMAQMAEPRPVDPTQPGAFPG